MFSQITVYSVSLLSQKLKNHFSTLYNYICLLFIPIMPSSLFISNFISLLLSFLFIDFSE